MTIRKVVKRLKSLALKLPRPGCDWEDRPSFQPPALRQEVDEFERTARFSLPAELQTFFGLTGAIVGMSVHNGYWVGGLENLMRSVRNGELPNRVSAQSAIPIATDGGGSAFLLAQDGSIWRWDHETEACSLVSHSFEAFLMAIAEDWQAYIEDRPGWRYLV